LFCWVSFVTRPPGRKTDRDSGTPGCVKAPVRTWLDEQRAIWEGLLGRLDAFAMKTMKERAE
jgi:hypothetical protein